MIAHILKYLDSSFSSCDSDTARDIEKQARIDAFFTLKNLLGTRPTGHGEALFRKKGTRGRSDIRLEITRYTSKRNAFRHDGDLVSKTIGEVYNELFPHHVLDHTVAKKCQGAPKLGV
ncbi:hypothetical protein [Candidatus Synchoanobacter obligatus]|uniref:Uncharacterized protein n=1 Tax=Candidatus Synchoanobacter obligatus TaxID=2919597 RepID=A0ABT1L4X5_9GAMM|nr:hypothetical protein [Candidatus Synchoanobacter obligatus]MCP8352229.1 hypothetical protein [Candidatus Synchoanobacter obligatus]